MSTRLASAERESARRYERTRANERAWILSTSRAGGPSLRKRTVVSELLLLVVLPFLLVIVWLVLMLSHQPR